MKVAPWITLVLGGWLVLSPFAIPYVGPAGAVAEDLIVGGLVIIFSLGLAVGPRAHPIAAWCLFVFGIWVPIAPFVLGYSRLAPDAVANDMLTGAIILLVAILRLFATRRGVPADKI